MKLDIKDGIKVNKRIEIVDFLRGLAIISMVIYHIYYDLIYVFGREISVVGPDFMYIIQQFSCSLFIFLAGFSMNLSRNPLKNSAKILFFAYLLTFITYMVMSEFIIVFGILHVLGLSVLIVGLIRKVINIENPRLILALAGISFVIFIVIKIKSVDAIYYSGLLRDLNFYPLGFYDENFISSDYFPLLPWFFLFLTGYFAGKFNGLKGNPIAKLDFEISLVNKMGRNSIKIYLLHQIVIIGILNLLFIFI